MTETQLLKALALNIAVGIIGPSETTGGIETVLERYKSLANQIEGYLNPPGGPATVTQSRLGGV